MYPKWSATPSIPRGCASACLGREWNGLLGRALEIALSEGLEEQAGRAFTNFYGTYSVQRRFTEGEQYYLDGIAYCDERDITTWATSLRGERTSVLEKTGRWDEAVALSTELLDRADPSPINRVYPLSKLGLIRGRRGEPGAWELLDEAMTAADRSGEPQRIVPVRLARAELYWLEGKTGEAGREVELAITDRPIATRGIMARSLSGYGARRPLAHRAMTSPSPTSACSRAIRREPRNCGPRWAAGTRPPWLSSTRPMSQRCAKP